MSSRRKDLTLKEKVNVIEYAKLNKCTQVELAKKFEISQAQVSKLLKNKEKVSNDWKCNKNLNQKRKRTGKESEVEDALLQWFAEKRACNVPISGLLLNQKAEDLARQLNITDFKATNGWLCRWKERNQISFKKIHGEASDADEAAASSWKSNVLPALLQDYSSSCIYNCDETALYYRAMPDGTLCLKGEKVVGGKVPKDRLTVLCCSNADGSHKMPLFVIGKSKNPRCFRGVKSLPVKYEANSNAWMTANFFQNWLVSFDNEMSKMKRKAILFIDNCTAHKVNVRLENVAIHFLPPNTTAILQPMDQGIISLFKRNYRKEVVKKMIACIDDDSGLSSSCSTGKISVLTAVHMMNKSWNNISSEAIKNCFVKCKFSTDITNDELSDESITNANDLPPEGMTEDNFFNFVNFDNDLEECGETSDPQPDQSEVDEDEFDEECSVNKVPSRVEVNNACDIIRRFLETKPNADFHLFYKLENQITDLLQSQNKQSKISDFFSNI